MAHKFDVRNKHKLDNEKRREILPPEKTLINLGLTEGDIMADIGCGIGYFSFPAAKIVGNNGLVYALDISPEMLQEVETKATENNYINIKTILTEENDFMVEEGKITFALICNVLHETANLEIFLGEVKKLISPKGKVAIVDWEKVTTEYGPPIEHRLDKLELTKLLEELGFSNISNISIGENFYGITALIN